MTLRAGASYWGQKDTEECLPCGNIYSKYSTVSLGYWEEERLQKILYTVFWTSKTREEERNYVTGKISNI